MIIDKMNFKNYLLHSVFPVGVGLIGGFVRFMQLDSLWNLSYWEKLIQSLFAAALLGAAAKAGAEVWTLAKKKFRDYFNKKASDKNPKP